MSTIEIKSEDLSWWRDCCKKHNLTSKELISYIRRKVELRKQQELYDSLPRPQNYIKPLSNKKLKKKYNKNRFV